MIRLSQFFRDSLLLYFLLMLFESNQCFSKSFFGAISVSNSIGTSSFSTDTDKPKVNILNIGASIGKTFFDFLIVGSRSSISKIFQTSEPTTSTGNRRGSRIVPFAPVVGFNFKLFRLQADYQMSGDYLFENKTTSGATLIYKKPTGIGIELMFKASSWIGLGLRYENVDFSQEQIGTASATTLSDKLSLKSYGLMVNVFF